MTSDAAHIPSESDEPASRVSRLVAGSSSPLGAGGLPTNELARHALDGDEQRFTELYERIAPAVFAWVHLRMGRAARGQFDPEDVVQEIWLRAAKAFAQFDPERGHFRGWIFQVTKYTLLDTFRALTAASRRATTAGSGFDMPSGPKGEPQPAVGPRGAGRAAVDLSQVPEKVTSFTRRIAREEGLQRLLSDIDSLPDAERELLAICGLEGRPASEAAVLLGLSHEAARKRWLRLRQQLAERREFAALID